MKFALKVEEELNKIIYPEYRQLVVEVMMVLSSILEHQPVKTKIEKVIALDLIVSAGYELFMEHQVGFPLPFNKEFYESHNHYSDMLKYLLRPLGFY